MTNFAGNEARPFRVLQRGNLIKICGLREPEHAVAAAAAGADLIGFIFAATRRRVAPETARRCVAAARSAAPDREILAVGVFVNGGPDVIQATCAEADLDVVQLHGDESPQFIADLGVSVIKSMRPRLGSFAAETVAEIDRFNASSFPPVAMLIDGYDACAAGGTGVRADWAVAAEIAAGRPIFLAGGLDAQNVAEAIRLVRPLGVDVSSGVEVNGAKDGRLIETFIHAARAGFIG